MTITISLLDALLIVLILFAIVLLYQLIVLIRNIIPSAKSLAKIMDDSSAITGAARSSAEDAISLVSDISESFSDVLGILKGNKSTVAAVTNMTNAITNLVGLVKKRRK